MDWRLEEHIKEVRVDNFSYDKNSLSAKTMRMLLEFLKNTGSTIYSYRAVVSRLENKSPSYFTTDEAEILLAKFHHSAKLMVEGKDYDSLDDEICQSVLEEIFETSCKGVYGDKDKEKPLLLKLETKGYELPPKLANDEINERYNSPIYGNIAIEYGESSFNQSIIEKYFNDEMGWVLKAKGIDDASLLLLDYQLDFVIRYLLKDI